jgi:hypothetical protein
MKFHLKQIIGDIYTGEINSKFLKNIQIYFLIYFKGQIGTSSNEYRHENLEAVTYGKAGEFSTIPSDHPLITVSTKQKNNILNLAN